MEQSLVLLSAKLTCSKDPDGGGLVRFCVPRSSKPASLDDLRWRKPCKGVVAESPDLLLMVNSLKVVGLLSSLPLPLVSGFLHPELPSIYPPNSSAPILLCPSKSVSLLPLF